MNKTISAERIFALGDYQNLKVTDSITEIPDAIARNPEAIKLLRFLQLVDIEWSYLTYQKLRLSEPKIVNSESIKSAIDYIESERTTTFEKLIESIQETKQEEN